MHPLIWLGAAILGGSALASRESKSSDPKRGPHLPSVGPGEGPEVFGGQEEAVRLADALEDLCSYVEENWEELGIRTVRIPDDQGGFLVGLLIEHPVHGAEFVILSQALELADEYQVRPVHSLLDKEIFVGFTPLSSSSFEPIDPAFVNQGLLWRSYGNPLWK